MKLNVSLSGLDGIKSGLKGMQDLGKTLLVDAAFAGGLEIMNRAQELAPVKTGTLRRSIHPEVIEQSEKRAVVRVGPDVPYAARLEFGFVGRDSLGRMYNQGPRPYMRPAYEETKAQVVQTINQIITERLIEEINARAANANRRKS